MKDNFQKESPPVVRALGIKHMLRISEHIKNTVNNNKKNPYLPTT